MQPGDNEGPLAGKGIPTQRHEIGQAADFIDFTSIAQARPIKLPGQDAEHRHSRADLHEDELGLERCRQNYENCRRAHQQQILHKRTPGRDRQCAYESNQEQRGQPPQIDRTILYQRLRADGVDIDPSHATIARKEILISKRIGGRSDQRDATCDLIWCDLALDDVRRGHGKEGFGIDRIVDGEGRIGPDFQPRGAGRQTGKSRRPDFHAIAEPPNPVVEIIIQHEIGKLRVARKIGEGHNWRLFVPSQGNRQGDSTRLLQRSCKCRVALGIAAIGEHDVEIDRPSAHFRQLIDELRVRRTGPGPIADFSQTRVVDLHNDDIVARRMPQKAGPTTLCSEVDRLAETKKAENYACEQRPQQQSLGRCRFLLLRPVGLRLMAHVIPFAILPR